MLLVIKVSGKKAESGLLLLNSITHTSRDGSFDGSEKPALLSKITR